MILRNFDSIMQVILCGAMAIDNTYDEITWLAGTPGIVRVNEGGYYRYQYSSAVYSSAFGFFGGFLERDNAVTPDASYPVMLVGSNNADESYDDYTMTYDLGLSVVGYRDANISYSEEGCTLTLTKTFINNTGSDITVKEVGIYIPAHGLAQGSSSSKSLRILICREKLSAPVTLAAGGGKATFALTINIPLMNKPL